MYNRHMADFKFSIPIQIRYGDLDAQWHVNNSRFLTFMEQARFEYLQQKGLFDAVSFLDLRMIIADVHIAYKAPIVLNQKIAVDTRTAKIGNKSITFDYEIRDEETGVVCATGEVVGVCYNYRSHETTKVPVEWRKKIAEYEGRLFE